MSTVDLQILVFAAYNDNLANLRFFCCVVSDQATGELRCHQVMQMHVNDKLASKSNLPSIDIHLLACGWNDNQRLDHWSRLQLRLRVRCCVFMFMFCVCVCLSACVCFCDCFGLCLFLQLFNRGG
jgi:hypothetical protein